MSLNLTSPLRLKPGWIFLSYVDVPNLHTIVRSRNLTQTDQGHGTTWKEQKKSYRENLLKFKAQTSPVDSFYHDLSLESRYKTRLPRETIKGGGNEIHPECKLASCPFLSYLLN